MKYRKEETHPALRSSLRSGEKERALVGDPHSEWRDRTEEQQNAFRKPEEPDARVVADEGDQGRTR